MNINRSEKPLPKGEIKFSLPSIERFTLDNGLRVVFVKKDTLPILRLNLLIDAGSKTDPETKKGLANLLSMCIDEGAGDYDSLQLSDEFESLGIRFNTNITEDHFLISLQTLKEYFDRALGLFSIVLTKPRFANEEFDREKRKVLTQLMQYKDSPDDIADSAFQHIIFGKQNPYAYDSAGYPEQIESLINSDIIEHYKKFILPSKSILIVVGDISKKELMDKLNTNLSGWKGNAAEDNLSFNSPEKKLTLYIVDKKNSVQSEIRTGYVTSKRNQADYFQKLLLNTALGGQFSSRINLNLREDKGYTYGAFSRFNYFKENGFFFVSTSVGIDNSANAVKEIIKELNGITEGIKPEELSFAQSSLIRKFPSNFETYKQVASNLIGMVIHNLPDSYLDEYIDKIKNVTKAEIDDIAKQAIRTDELSIVVVGDKAKLLTQFENFDNIKIVEADIYGNVKN